MDWQRGNILAAANYLRELMAAGHKDARVQAVYQGLLEVLDPARRSVRLQRELADSTKAAAISAARHSARIERRSGRERRSGGDRRRTSHPAPASSDRRTGRDRRSGRDRRKR